MTMMWRATPVALCIVMVLSRVTAQAPAPAPADPCPAATGGLVNTCGAFVTAVGQAAATLVNATNAQVTAAVANLTSKPTSQCCAFYGNTYLAQSCNCDPAVIQLAAQQGTSAIQVATQTRVWKAACNIPSSSDHCPIGGAYAPA